MMDGCAPINDYELERIRKGRVINNTLEEAIKENNVLKEQICDLKYDIDCKNKMIEELGEKLKVYEAEANSTVKETNVKNDEEKIEISDLKKDCKKLEKKMMF